MLERFIRRSEYGIGTRAAQRLGERSCL
jgi:hypothetical protein